MLDDHTERTLTAVRTLLAGAVDYAGLFPPAGLSIPEAVVNYAAYRNSNYAWMLGRFVVGAAKLDEFVGAARDLVSREAPWPISVVSDDDVAGTIERVARLNEENSGIVCDMLEIRADAPSTIENAAASLSPNVTAYFELALDGSLPEMAVTLALNGQRAKIRTGGVTADAFPSAREIVRFVRTCLAANVPFKATAGLHHPIRCFRPLTYEADSVSGTMHGFLNLFLMTGFAMQGFRTPLLEDLMEEEFDEVFQFADQTVTWRDEYTLSTWQIERLRNVGIQSFGSCSFDEPVADLQKLGIL